MNTSKNKADRILPDGYSITDGQRDVVGLAPARVFGRGRSAAEPPESIRDKLRSPNQS